MSSSSKYSEKIEQLERLFEETYKKLDTVSSEILPYSSSLVEEVRPDPNFNERPPVNDSQSGGKEMTDEEAQKKLYNLKVTFDMASIVRTFKLFHMDEGNNFDEWFKKVIPNDEWKEWKLDQKIFPLLNIGGIGGMASDPEIYSRKLLSYEHEIMRMFEKHPHKNNIFLFCDWQRVKKWNDVRSLEEEVFWRWDEVNRLTESYETGGQKQKMIEMMNSFIDRWFQPEVRAEFTKELDQMAPDEQNIDDAQENIKSIREAALKALTIVPNALDDQFMMASILSLCIKEMYRRETQLRGCYGVENDDWIRRLALCLGSHASVDFIADSCKDEK